LNAPDSVCKLVELFEEQREEYHKGKYNETQLRLDFLNPFFEALGWDVSNHKGYAERYREVLLEPSVEVAGQAKAADYAFRVGDKTLFFVEAKKPAVNIGANPEPAFQVRRYGWSAKLSLSILSDFEQMAVYDCRAKPKHGDPASDERVQLYSFHDYLEKWDEISAIFSREAVLKGSFDKFAEGMKGKKGTADVDDAFLEEMERWREELAHNIALRNPSLSQRELNSAVQTTIDRMIFLRICEEHGIEAQDALRNAAQGKNVYESLVELFKQADKKYNSGLFHFSEEKKQSSYPDTLTLALKIDDKVLKDILAHLYYPLSPYAFKYIPTDILGQVYERFLGKVIRLTAGHQAKVEEKPEVRKAGGVYYTPTYIVAYIVKHTLGELLKEQSPESQKNKPLRVLDPACGSGSFLLGAYQYLLDWHLDWYIHNDPARWSRGKAPALVENQGGWQLTMDKKKEILLSHLYGVDIDAQAVEVTKLSLLLKVVENPGQLSWLNERILPDLGENIKCGNSLIGPDYYEGRQMPMFGDEESYRLNVFDWQKAFPQVFAVGGFDAVIGNPPYIRMEEFKDLKYYLKANYACHEERSDIYAYFIEKMQKVLRRGGRFGMIVSNKFVRANYGKPLRDFLRNNVSIDRIVDFAGLPVFKGATVRTIVLLTSRKEQIQNLLYSPPLPINIFEKIESHALDIEKAIIETTYEVPSSALAKDSWSFAKQDSDNLMNKLALNAISLVKYCDDRICRGVVSGLTEAFIIDRKTRDGIIAGDPKSAEIIKPFINGRDIRRYSLVPKDIFIIYTYHNVKITDYPAIEQYLKPFKDKLKSRATRQEWYELQQPQYAYTSYFEGPKIVFPDIATSPRFVLDENGYYGSNTIYFIPKRDLFLLGLLNSKLGYFYFRIVCAGLEGKNEIYLRFFGQYLEGFPVVKADAARHARMVALVEGMLALHKQAAAARLPQEKEMIQRQIQATDGQIDRLVYELYGLTEEEIKIVEGG